LTCRLQFDRVRASILGQISIVTGGEFGDGLVGRTQADDPLADVEAINHHEPAFTFWCAATSTGESGLVAHREQLAQGLRSSTSTASSEIVNKEQPNLALISR